jgi:hypothetical protein
MRHPPEIEPPSAVVLSAGDRDVAVAAQEGAVRTDADVAHECCGALGGTARVVEQRHVGAGSQEERQQQGEVGPRAQPVDGA